MVWSPTTTNNDNDTNDNSNSNRNRMVKSLVLVSQMYYIILHYTQMLHHHSILHYISYVCIHIYIYIYIYICTYMYLSNATCLMRPHVVVHGTACLIRLLESAALFATFEEDMCQTSSVRQVVPPWQTQRYQVVTRCHCCHRGHRPSHHECLAGTTESVTVAVAVMVVTAVVFLLCGFW